jgi:CheY-like chemotaxis protein
MKILYVEDNDDNVYMLKNRLSRAGFTVVVATNGARGIAMASSEQPDLILMDLTLPDIRGEEATQRILIDPKVHTAIETQAELEPAGELTSRASSTRSRPSTWWRCAESVALVGAGFKTVLTGRLMQ